MPLTRLKVRRKEILENPVRDNEKKGHLVQFYETEKFLAESVACFIQAGFEKKQGAIVVATRKNSQVFLEALSLLAVDIETAQKDGRLCIFDADEILSSFMNDKVINEELFKSKITDLVRSVKSESSEIRVYGEMVNLLWERKNVSAMFHLEQLWNEVMGAYPFSLLCGYKQSAFDYGKYSKNYEQICSNHTHVLPSEKYLEHENLDDELRAIAQLQQQASSLNNELKKRKEAEKALRQSEAFKNLIIENSRDCIKVADLDGKILFMNKSGFKTFEIQELESLQNTSWLEFWKKKYKKAATLAFEKAKQGQTGEFTGYLPTLVSKAPKWWHVVTTPIYNDDNEVWRILIVSHDVTDREILENNLRKAIQTRDEFLSIASHELKTPITSLKLQAQVQQRRFERRDPTLLEWTSVGKMIDMTRRQVDRLSALVDDMLDISKIAHGKLSILRERFNLGSLVCDVVDRFDEQLRTAGCKYSITTESQVIGEWDRFRIEQVITNLITNVIKYSSGKPVDIKVHSQDREAVLSVQDEGIGISEENIERIFQRFERATSSTHISGLGLGLYISRQIVEAHQGQIQLESALGKGSKFTVRLPIN